MSGEAPDYLIERMQPRPFSPDPRLHRSAFDRSLPKCGCGNILARHIQEAGGKLCVKCEAAQEALEIRLNDAAFLLEVADALDDEEVGERLKEIARRIEEG